MGPSPPASRSLQLGGARGQPLACRALQRDGRSSRGEPLGALSRLRRPDLVAFRRSGTRESALQEGSGASPSVFPLLDKDALPGDLQSAWQRSMQRRGEARFVAAAAQAPELYRWYSEAFYGGLFHGGQAPAYYKEMGRLRLSTVHGCRSCNLGNRVDAAEAGLSEEQVQNIQDARHPCFDGADRAVLALADLVSLDGAGATLSQDLYAQLRTSFTDGQIFELGMVFALLAGHGAFSVRL